MYSAVPPMKWSGSLRMKRLPLAMGLVCAVAVLSACSDSSDDDAGASGSGSGAAGASCDSVSLAGLDDDSHRAAFYALENGQVKSDLIPDIDISYLQIPALIQATGTGQYTYVMTSLPGMVNAREAGGLDLRPVAYSLAHTGDGIALYVRADSDIKSAKDLAGKRLATPSFGSTATQEAQIVLAEKYGLDPATEGGDITWVELDPNTQLNALKQGDIDVALMWHQGGWTASNDPELRNVAQLDVEFKDVANGAWPTGAAFVADGEYVDDNLDCVHEFQRMLSDSVDYAKEHSADFADEIAEESGVPAEFINFWWQDGGYQFGGVVNDEWMTWVGEFYKLAAKHGFIPSEPDLQKITVMPES